MSKVKLRQWQVEFMRELRDHAGDDFLLVACPAAGKTIAAAAGAAELMADREADQLIVVAPTVVVRDQWALELGKLGYKLPAKRWRGQETWPEHVHGVCATYAQVAYRAAEFAEACRRRRTVVILDEVHHAGKRLSWGDGISIAFQDAAARLALSGTPFRSDGDSIPFVEYGKDDISIADYAYDYARAVADGVCRTIEFKAHDGEITWTKDDQEVSATFSQKIARPHERRRLRASLDPAQPFLTSMLEAAVDELTQMRTKIPDAAGLVVCDSQAHALEVDRLLNEISGTVPTLAISDLPRSHHAIAGFVHELDEWLVSVRMVAEGVDIPRLGVIVWATTSSTELMVRQVAGRALRGRREHAAHSAVVHMPADPQLIEYAERIDVLAGTMPREHKREAPGGGRKRGREVSAAGARVPHIDPTPFVKWFDKQASFVGVPAVCARLNVELKNGARMIYAWREEGRKAHPMTLYDFCYAAGVDFDDMFADEAYAEARAYVADPSIVPIEGLDFNSVLAVANGHYSSISPAIDAPPSEPEPAEATAVTPPWLPDSPDDLAAAAAASRSARADLYRLLSIYTQLRRGLEPSFSVAGATRALTAAVGVIAPESSDDVVGEAIDWVNEQAAELAFKNPEMVKNLARARRRAQVGR